MAAWHVSINRDLCKLRHPAYYHLQKNLLHILGDFYAGVYKALVLNLQPMSRMKAFGTYGPSTPLHSVVCVFLTYMFT